jgi:hypothetical protein
LNNKSPVEVGGTLAKLQQQNMRLQNLKLSNEGQISDLQKKATNLQIRLYISYVLIVAALLLGSIIGYLIH